MIEFVPFEIAKKLKEKGFDRPCIYAYCEEGGWNKYTQVHEPIIHILKTDGNPFGSFYTGKNWNIKYETNKNKIRCSAPTISQVLKWLRDEKKLYLGINYMPQIMECSDYYFPTIQYIGELKPVVYAKFTDIFKTYEEAALAGIEYVLDNILL